MPALLQTNPNSNTVFCSDKLHRAERLNMSANASDEIDPRATAAAVEASATSAGATTTAIAGNTMIVMKNK